jgi:hypothetical protein
MRVLLRWAILVVAVAGLVYGFLMERRTIMRVSAEPQVEREVNALEFIEDATVDGYIRRDGQLADLYSLKPAFAQVKDCAT